MVHDGPRALGLALLVAGVSLLTGCVSAPATPAAVSGTPWAHASLLPTAGALAGDAGWEHYHLPGKTAVQFLPVRVDGRDTLAATAVSAASIVRHRVRIEPADLGSLRFSWKVPQLIADADVALREADDSPVRLILAFDGNRSHFSTRDALLSELMRSITGEEMPYATLMYVWCNKRTPGSVVRSPRTDRIRKLVLESGPGRLDQWLDYTRDIRADFQRAFGEPPGALIGVGIMTDSDNTRATARAWYGPVRFGPVATASAP